MSRSKHTRPEQILAASRVRAPHEARGQDDQSSFRRLARVLKESGIIVNLPDSSGSGDPIIPRIIAKRPRQGYVHPAEKADILSVLQFFGERCFYGLRLIKLIQGTSTLNGVGQLMGRLKGALAATIRGRKQRQHVRPDFRCRASESPLRKR